MKRPMGFVMLPSPPEEFEPLFAALFPDDFASPFTPKGAPKALENENGLPLDEVEEVAVPECEAEFAARFAAAFCCTEIVTLALLLPLLPSAVALVTESLATTAVTLVAFKVACTVHF